jgi:hypothetical protein
MPRHAQFIHRAIHWLKELVRGSLVRVQLFGVGGELQWQQQEQKEEDNPHGDPPGKGTTIAFSLLAAWKSVKRTEMR